LNLQIPSLDIAAPRGRASGGSSLLASLSEYYALEEASGTRLDSTAAHKDLTSNNAVGQAAGKVGNAASFAAASSQYLSRANMSPGTGDWTIAAWLWFDALSGDPYPISFYGGTPTEEVDIFLTSSSSLLSARYYDGAAYRTTTASTFGAVVISTWYFVCARYIKATKQLRFRVNATEDSNIFANAAVVSDGSATLTLGRYAAGGQYQSGRADEVGIWSVALTDTQVVNLRNSGSGVTYPFNGVP
jgi:hypothetical protein